MPTPGTFRKTENGFEGEVFLDDGRGRQKRTLVRNTSENGPDFHLEAANGAPIGAAWEKKSERTGNSWISISEDNATSRNGPINYSLHHRGGNEWDAVFSRTRASTRENDDLSQESNQAPENRKAKKAAPERDTGMER